MYWFAATILLVMMVSSGCDTPTTPPAPIDSLRVGLVAYYPCDGTTYDSSGNGHSGVAMGSIPVSDRFLHQSGAFFFTGDSASGITIDHAGDLNFAGILDFTICFWYKLTDTSRARGGIICKAANGPGMVGYQMQFENAGLLTLLVGTNRGLARLRADVPSDTLWHFVAAVVSRKTSDLSLFLDREPVAYTVAPSINGSVDTKAPVLIGRDYNGGDNYSGMLDDIRIYNRSMRLSELRRLFEFPDERP
jgi:hypothetical protein